MPRHALMAAVIGLAATLLALGVATLGGAGATALEWSVYDRGVRARAAALDGHLAAPRSWLPGARMPLALPAALPFAGPLPGLAQHARAVGHTLAAVDPDGVVRRVPVFVRLNDAAVPSFGLALAMAFMDVRPDQVVVARGGVVIPQPGSGLAPGRVPLDGRGRALVTYAAPQRLNLVSFLDIWTP